MKLYFKPFPGLTISVAIALAILLALGTWQFQRLQWKTALLSEIEQVSDAPPFTSLSEVQAALEAGEPIDFRRFGANAEHVTTTPFFVFTPRGRDVSWRVFAPMKQDVITVFAALGTIPDGIKDKTKSSPSGEDNFVGYVRLARPITRGETKSSPDRNRWFGFNPMPATHSWADSISADAEMRFYVDTLPGALDASALPARRPDIRNNHLDYMLTWYGLALVLLVIYLIMHQRSGRLKLL